MKTLYGLVTEVQAPFFVFTALVLKTCRDDKHCCCSKDKKLVYPTTEEYPRDPEIQDEDRTTITNASLEP